MLTFSLLAATAFMFFQAGEGGHGVSSIPEGVPAFCVDGFYALPLFLRSTNATFAGSFFTARRGHVDPLEEVDRLLPSPFAEKDKALSSFFPRELQILSFPIRKQNAAPLPLSRSSLVVLLRRQTFFSPFLTTVFPSSFRWTVLDVLQTPSPRWRIEFFSFLRRSPLASEDLPFSCGPALLLKNAFFPKDLNPGMEDLRWPIL